MRATKQHCIIFNGTMFQARLDHFFHLDLFQARLERRHLSAIAVVHVAIRIRWGAVRDLQVRVAGMQVKLRKLGQVRELFRDAAWHHGAICQPKYDVYAERDIQSHL